MGAVITETQVTNYISWLLKRETEMRTRLCTVWKKSCRFLFFVASVLISMLHLMDEHLGLIRSHSSTGALLQLFRIQTEVQELGKRI